MSRLTSAATVEQTRIFRKSQIVNSLKPPFQKGIRWLRNWIVSPMATSTHAKYGVSQLGLCTTCNTLRGRRVEARLIKRFAGVAQRIVHENPHSRSSRFSRFCSRTRLEKFLGMSVPGYCRAEFDEVEAERQVITFLPATIHKNAVAGERLRLFQQGGYEKSAERTI